MPSVCVRPSPTCRSPKAFRFGAAAHTLRLPLGRRLVVPGENPANAIRAGRRGVVSTAGGTSPRFFAQLAPNAKRNLPLRRQPPGR